jgi:copper(I)-binding protein
VAVTTLRSRFTLAAVALVVPALAGCSTNFSAPTDQVYTPAAGVNDRSGEVYVLNALVVSPADGTGTVIATLVNNDAVHPDKLVKVTVDGTDARIDTAAGGADIAAGGHNNLGASGAVTASAPSIVAGTFVDVTFTFQRAEAITVEALVVPHEGDFADVPLREVS